MCCCKKPNYTYIIYKGLRILTRYCSCQDSEFRSALETSSVDIDKLLSKNFFLWIQCPQISLLLFKDGADLRMESFSCKQSPHTLLLGANGFSFDHMPCNNHRLLQLHRMKESSQDSKLCNCLQKNSCPLDGKCLTKCVVYKATVTETTSNNQETYIGLTGNEFKTRFNLHKSSFKLEHKRTSTTPSDHVWKLKKKNINFNITWQVVKRVKPFAPSNKES